MADLMLIWYISGPLSETGVKGSNYGVEYTLDKDYRPLRLILRMKEEPAADGEPCTIDINAQDNGVGDKNSIFPNDKPIIASAQETYIDWADSILRKDSVITLDIDQVSPKTSGKDLTVQLDLEEI